eukprot:TRINITY_DN31855_c0_g1_i1.p1 TRINITY_DN31855_c0_g1~~TRINITY_DN31855_c0_g1_i1.p1  ORF type:complete len:558 (-),score=130.21 TRINITY_DN31855_c0_g1_i1:1644-3203(-)
MSELLSRIHRTSLHSRIVPAEATAKFFKDGMKLGFSGFTPTNYPKVVPIALCDYVEKNNLKGKMSFDLIAGASIGEEVEGRMTDLGMIRSRFPYQTGKSIGKWINTGKMDFADTHLSLFASKVAYGFYALDRKQPFDIGVVEATEILEDGSIILGGAVGMAPEVLENSAKLIIEVNTLLPSYRGIHDILPNHRPPGRKPVLITRCDTRAGFESVRIDPDRIVAIVESRKPDNGRALSEPDDVSKMIAGHILEFFEHEVKAGRLPANLLPLQSGVGNIANAVVAGFSTSKFENVSVWTEVLQDTMLDFLDSGKLQFATTTALSLSPKATERFYKDWERYRRMICIRPQHITNSPEVIKRLGVLAMNTPVEIDMYGHANSTTIGGTRIINGIGGSGDFLRNAYISMMHTPSVRPTKNDPTGISCIVPHCSHIDHTEHDIDCFATEQGIADLRGLSPKKRAQEIINKVVHPDYKPILQDYLDYATRKCIASGSGHEPQLLDVVYKMHLSLAKNGTMKVDNWN